jgi:hypothetical protein
MRIIAIVKVRMDNTLRSIETCKFAAVFVALGLEPPVVVCVPLVADVLLEAVLLEAVLLEAVVLEAVLLEAVLV